jgi:ParB-like chromosome segregation protein Spo0J
MLKVETVPIGELTADPANVRTHGERNIEAIRRSLETFGQRKPLVVARGAGGELVVVAGNGTLEAARALGLDTLVVAVVPDEWDAAKARAYAIADNRTGELADWNDVALSEALVELEAGGFEPAVLGFGDLAGAPGSVDAGFAQGGEDPYLQQYGVIVTCSDEAEQRAVYEHLLGEGYACRVVTV